MLSELLKKVFVWDGIILFVESDFEGMKSKQEATSVKINIPVDQKYFIMTNNIKFKEAPDIDDIVKMIEEESEEK